MPASQLSNLVIYESPTISGIVTGDTVLFTLTDNRIFIPVLVKVSVTGATNVVTPPTIRIGKSTSAQDEYLADTVLPIGGGGVASFRHGTYLPPNNTLLFSGPEVDVVVSVELGGVSNVYNFVVHLIGYYFP